MTQSQIPKNILDTPLMIVVGPSGSGKSSLIESLCEERPEVISFGICGREFISSRATIEGQLYQFLDAPGFDNFDRDDWATFEILTAVLREGAKVTGVLYVDPFGESSLNATARTTLNWLYDLCGAHSMPNVVIVTTKWDELETHNVEAKLQNFNRLSKSRPIARFLESGAAIYHHGLDLELNYKTLPIKHQARERNLQARRFLAGHFRGCSTIQLRICTELINGVKLQETAAGKWIWSHFAARTPSAGHSSTNNEGDTSYRPPNIQMWVDGFVQMCRVVQALQTVMPSQRHFSGTEEQASYSDHFLNPESQMEDRETMYSELLFDSDEEVIQDHAPFPTHDAFHDSSFSHDFDKEPVGGSGLGCFVM